MSALMLQLRRQALELSDQELEQLIRQLIEMLQSRHITPEQAAQIVRYDPEVPEITFTNPS